MTIKKVALTVLSVMLLSVLQVTVRNASAAPTLLFEDFEGTFPPADWSVTNDYAGSPVVWHRSDESPTYGATQGLPISGLHAYAESYPAYCGYSYDTSLVSPSFSTQGMRHVEVQFDYQYWVYSSEFLALDYRIGAGPWVNLQNLPSIGGFAVQSLTVDISATIGNPSVQLRWRYYNLGSGCDWWANIDNVGIVGDPIKIPTLNEWGMIIFLVLAGLVSVYYIKRQTRKES